MTTTDKANEAKLKLAHIIWMILIAVIGASLALGAIKNQQTTNTKQIKQQELTKVGKDVFQMHQEQQLQQTKDTKDTMIRGFDRIDESLKEIQKKLP